MSFWGSLFSAGAGLLGGFMNNNSQQAALNYQKKLNKNRISWTVEDAKRAGIHPLAALGSPAAGSFAVPTAPTALGDAIGDAGAAIGAGISRTEANARTREQDSLNKDLLRAQIRNVDAETSRTLAEARSRTAIGTIRRNPGATATAEQLRIAGMPIKQNEGFSDAQDMSDRYGDFVEGVAGVGTAVADALTTLGDYMRMPTRAPTGADIVRRNERLKRKYRYQRVPDLGGYNSP